MLTKDDLSEDQVIALDRIGEWYTAVNQGTTHCDDEECAPYAHTHGSDEPAPVYSLGGEAGVGKTTVMRWLENHLGCSVSYGVPTHKAARVLRGKLGEDSAADQVNTFHSLVFFPNAKFICSRSRNYVQEMKGSNGMRSCGCADDTDCECPRQFSPCGSCTGPCMVEEQLRWEDRPYLRGHLDLLVLDESSMVSEDDVEKMRAFGVPMLLVGDYGQLPPVKATMNPWTRKPDVELTVNHRQANDTSGIVDVALGVRGGWKPQIGAYGDGRTRVVARTAPGVGDLLTPGRYAEGQRPAIICPWNKLRANINKRFHGSGPVRAGDEVVALSRCMVPLVTSMNGDVITGLGASVTVHNGQIGTVIAVTSMRAKTCDLVIDVEDIGRVLVANAALDQFGRPTALALNERPYGSRLWDYAYAITAHKAQGSEWDNVLVLDESPPDYARWMYTAVTRAKDKLIVVRY